MKVIDASQPSHRHYWDELLTTLTTERLHFVDPAALTGHAKNEPHLGENRHKNILWVGEQFPDHLELEFFEGGLPLFSETHDLVQISLDDRLHIIDQIASAIDHAHQHTLIHGNLAPQNILLRLSDRQVKIADFFGYGLAMVDPYVVDSIYRAPEWSQNRERDQRQDIYAFAVIAYRLLLGEFTRRFESEIGKIIEADAAIASTDGWRECFQRALALEPAKRFDSCGALVNCVRSKLEATRSLPRVTSKPSKKEGPNDVWITNTIVVRVDDEGYLVDAWSEGVFGCVLKLESRDNIAPTKLALKVPRLLADTSTENNFICRLMEIEVDAVWRACQNYPEGLMPTRSIDPYPLQGARSLNGPDSSRQDGHFLLMCFPKNRPPRMCSIAMKESLSVFPESLLSEMGDLFKDRSLIRRITENTRKLITIEKPRNGDEERPIWYAGLPATLYNWAPITLQETLLQNYNASWNIEDYIQLFLRILAALKKLHSLSPRLLHGDLRPANILCYTTADPADRSQLARQLRPTLYHVADYGSFSVALFDGKLDLGPVVGRYRRSPFYSPERRTAEESESANVAVFVEVSEPEPAYAVCLGWKTTLTEPDSGKVKSETVQAIKKAATSGEEQPGIAGIQAGDSLRLRNYVFRVKNIRKSEDLGEIYICDKRVATVMQERLSVYLTGSVLSPVDVLNLPNYSVLKRPTPAVDLFSFGALLLYCFFASSSPTSDERKKDEEKDKTLDEAFAGTMAVLESKPYLNVLWRDCEAIRAALDSLRKQFSSNSDLPVSGARNVLFRIPSSLKLEKLEGERPDEYKTIYELTKQVANNILQSAPHISWILEKLDYNLAKFVLLVQFVLSCLHYADDLSGDQSGESDATALLPICCNRQHAEDGSPVEELERRFIDIFSTANIRERSLFDCPPCQEFVMPFEARRAELLTYNPRSDVFLRIASSRQTILKENAEARSRLLEDQKKELEDSVARLNQDIGQLQERIRTGEKTAGSTAEMLKASESQVASLSTRIAQLRALSKRMPKTSFGNYEAAGVNQLFAELNK